MKHRISFATILLFIMISSIGCVKSKPFDYYITPMPGMTQVIYTPAAEIVTPTMSFAFPPQSDIGAIELTPTPDAPHFQTPAMQNPSNYIVRAGDMLSAIAMDFNVSVEALAQANDIRDPDSLEVGQSLIIPLVTPQEVGPSFKIIPDSELVFGPMSGLFSLETFIEEQRGYLASYAESVKGETLTGAQIVDLVAKSASVNPRLILALLEYCTGWVTNPDPGLKNSPFQVNDGFHEGLYLELTWASDILNYAYYRWKAGNFTQFALEDGSVIQINPVLNAGTVGVQFFFAQRDDLAAWNRDISPGGFFDTYYLLFGDPFNLGIEPLLPINLSQPEMMLPFEQGRLWAFTGGPHSSWNPGTPFGALDFAPSEVQGCIDSDAWITAVADGLITRTGLGTVYQDLDWDGNEGSGWVVLYMHVSSTGRVTQGIWLKSGGRIGHPSCEGGISNGSHLHIARKFNGEWIPAYGVIPFDLGGWISEAGEEEGWGTLHQGDQVLEASDGSFPTNQLTR